MLLTLEERLNLHAVLPRKGTRVTCKAIDDFLRELQLTEKELVDYEIQELPNGQLRLNATKLPPEGFEISITDWRRDLILKTFDALDKQGPYGEFPIQLSSLWDRLEDKNT